MKLKTEFAILFSNREGGIHYMRQAFSLFLGLVTAVGLSSGAVTTYSSLSSWSAAINPATGSTIDFNGLSPVNSNVTSITDTVGGETVTFTPLNIGESLQISNAGGTSCNGGKCLFEWSTTAIRATHTAVNVRAIGFNIWTQNDPNVPVTIRIFYVGNATTTPDYTSTSIATNNGNDAPAIFFGAVTDAAIKKIEIAQGAATDMYVDNYTFARWNDPEPPPPSETPEVPTLSYVGIGFLAVFLSRARRNVSQ